MRQSVRFIKAFEKLMRVIGAVESDKAYSYKYCIETIYGKYHCHIHHTADEKWIKLFSIFGKFDDPARAFKGVDCNQYSGKWNFHVSGPNECLSRFKLGLGTVLS